jgi:manganese/zinc/iron transport system permease protein
LTHHGLATLDADRGTLFLTPTGWQLAAAIVRNHRLWELYLTNAAHIAADHVHEDAEKIEHVLGEEVVRELERRLQYATHDPHGRAIPNLDVIRRGTSPESREPLVGYGKRP